MQRGPVGATHVFEVHSLMPVTEVGAQQRLQRCFQKSAKWRQPYGCALLRKCRSIGKSAGNGRMGEAPETLGVRVL